MAKKTLKKTTPKTTKKVEKEKIVEEVKAIIVNEGIETNTETIEEISDTSEAIEKDPPLEVVNGDPSVVTPTDEIEEEAMANTFKKNNTRKLNVDPFTYSWNGQEIDYIL